MLVMPKSKRQWLLLIRFSQVTLTKTVELTSEKKISVAVDNTKHLGRVDKIKLERTVILNGA